MSILAELLPSSLMQRASLRGREYAWPLADIPDVIEAARRANLINVGGQLQFRIPGAGTCECYWVEVNTFDHVPKSLPWNERVERTAAAALTAYQQLHSDFDFLAEGRLAFAKQLDELERRGEDPAASMCFVWYARDQSSERRKC